MEFIRTNAQRNYKRNKDIVTLGTGGSGGGMRVSTGGGSTSPAELFAFEIIGTDLWIITEDIAMAERFSIDSDGCLIYEINV